MQLLKGAESVWAREQFGDVRLGDSRRVARLVNMAARAAQAPSGKVSDVFATDRERQGAYDFLESRHVDATALTTALGQATAQRAASESFCFVAVDGSSVSLVDRFGTKDFGTVGALAGHSRGLKVISALGINPAGIPVGLFTQVWWARTQARSQTRQAKQRHVRRRRSSEKETRYWMQAIEQTTMHAQATGAKLWFQLDREADNQAILLALAESRQRFTVRGAWDRLLETTGRGKRHLQRYLKRVTPGGRYLLDIAAGPKRMPRRARIVVRWATVVLRLRNERCKPERLLPITAVWLHEEGRTPSGEQRLDWMLLTNAAVVTFDDARQVIFGYTQRWRIEEFHKTWKSGVCTVEQTQLRSQRAVSTWATILAAVAARIERLKYLSRTEPEQPATVELTPHEIRALILLKREYKKRTETISDATPSIAQATLWIAELGGYTGKSSGGPPGSITIRRGLDRLQPAAQLLVALERQSRSDQ
jgi:hypothetical protein